MPIVPRNNGSDSGLSVSASRGGRPPHHNLTGELGRDIFIDMLAALVALLLAFVVNYSLDRQWDNMQRERDQRISEHMSVLQRLASSTVRDHRIPNDQEIQR